MQFRAAIAAARGGDSSAVPEVSFKDENGVPFGMVHCDGCQRNFNPDSGARHMLVCKDIKAKPKMLVRGSGQSASSVASRTTNSAVSNNNNNSSSNRRPPSSGGKGGMVF